jgi:geranylgeranyl diphosphate synthase type I
MSKLPPELDKFFASAETEVDHALRSLVSPHEDSIPNLDDGLLYALGIDHGSNGAGKRLRPLLCLLVSHSLCGKTRPALPFATAIELMHNFCLVHDDIEDGDEYRRGRPAVWKQYGLPHAINIGDYLFTKIFAALLSGLGEITHEKMVRFFALMGATLDHTHRGQALDINAREGAVTIQQYMRIVTEKTGYYLAAPLVAGAIAADAPQEVEEALNSYGMFIGPMFQIRDDVIDLTKGKGRESVGSDIREGKRSFMVAYACEHADKKRRARLLEILDLPRAATRDAHVAEAMGIFEAIGALKEADRVCGELKANAFETLAPLPDGLRDRLWKVTEHLANRTA